MGTMMLDVSTGIAECVLSVVDVNADGTIGWDEFESAFIATIGRRLLRLKMEAERLQDSKLPSLLPRYKSTIAAISRCQASTERLFRTMREEQYEEAPESAYVPSETEVLQNYITKLSALRTQLQVGLQTMKKGVATHEANLNDSLDDMLRDLDQNLSSVANMQDHASMLGAADAPTLGALATFVSQLGKDVEKLAQQIKIIQETAAVAPGALPSYIRKAATTGKVRRGKRTPRRSPRSPRK
jgi:chromosome segregation ATPase